MDTLIPKTTMEQFSNETIDTAALPKFEETQLTPLHRDYKKILFFNIGLVFFTIAVAAGLAIYFVEGTKDYWLPIVIGYIIIAAVTIIVTLISFRNKGFAFRNHDVIYRSGAIVLETTIIPYNRVQHVTLHEGILSRRLGLATIEIFTAGGINSDITVPGIEKEHAEKIKQLLVGKILKQDSTDGE
jgi:membrane protein YdbS with pleckstrin-like domain